MVINVTCGESITWREVLNIYVEELNGLIGKNITVKYFPSISDENLYIDKWLLYYDRLCNRRFDNEKLMSVIGDYSFVKPEQGLRSCLRESLETIKTECFNPIRQAWFDKATKRWSHYRDFNNFRGFISYLLYRLPLGRFVPFLRSFF